MAGLVPAIHVFLQQLSREDVDARVKPGHDEPSGLLSYPKSGPAVE